MSVRSLLFSLLVLLMGLPLVGQELDLLSFGEDDSFDVMTWNIEDFPKSGSITIDSVSKIITNLEMDVIGMQEIDDTTAMRNLVNNLPDYELYIAEGFYRGLVYVYNKNTVTINSVYKIYDTFQFWDIFLRAPVVMECTFMNQDFVLINNHYKCCGDGNLEIGNLDDEEGIRYESNKLMKDYIDMNLASSQVIVMGDFNDNIVDIPVVNVFQEFIEDEENYLFSDIDIAFGSSAFWSFPNWPSHLDHLLITNELFEEFEHSESDIQTLRIDDYMLGLNHYDNRISDHRPVALKLKGVPVSTIETENVISDIRIYPNPSYGDFILELGELEGAVSIEVRDVVGNLVQSQSYDRSRNLIDISLDAIPGIYFVFIKSGDKSGVVRLVKN